MDFINQSFRMPQDYMYTAGDGFVNPLGWSIAHIACKYGDASPSVLVAPPGSVPGSDDRNKFGHSGHVMAVIVVQT